MDSSVADQPLELLEFLLSGTFLAQEISGPVAAFILPESTSPSELSEGNEYFPYFLEI
jgi:hypothetical protein